MSAAVVNPFDIPAAMLPILRDMGQRVTQKSKEEFAKLLKDWRERHQLTQVQAAAELGTSRRTLEQWEIARARPVGLAYNLLLKLLAK